MKIPMKIPMNDSFPVRGRRAVLLAVVLAILLALTGSPARAHDETPGAIEAYLHGLVDDGALTEVQHEYIDHHYAAGHLKKLVRWLDAQERGKKLTHDVNLYVKALLGLAAPDPAPRVAAPANYTGNGNVTKLGQINVQPPSPYYGDNSSTGTLYNGIWGYAAGVREYALQCNSFGLHVIDVTDPAAPFQVQYIDMSGGVSPPKGRIWRDVDIHRDPASGKTYAYVGAQASGNFWVVDLSYLSDSAPQGVDSNPIPPAGIADRGRTNYGHTVFVNDGLGLLFLNTANNASTLGCQIFDLLQNPFDPPLLPSWTGSGRDCHDSFARSNVPGSGGKDLLYSSEGYGIRYSILDITNVRTAGTPTLVGETPTVSGIYAHSNWLDDDSHYLYAFDEFNVRDIGVYDVSNPASPAQVGTFQYSGDATANSRVHNGQVRGKYLLTAYYEAGFRVFDVSNPVNPVEVGKYETWRDPDGDGTFNKTITGAYNGAWNLHVFLPSGNVLVSDMKSGTFIFRVDPIAAPGASSGLAATPGNGQVGLTWTVAGGATGSTLSRSTTSGGPYTVVRTNLAGTSTTDTGLVNGTTYYYVVSGTNAEGEGAASNQASATPSVPTVATTTTVTSAPNPSASGQSVTFTATVTSGSGVPAGSVTFSEGATVLASGVTVNGAGQAAFSTTTLAVGSHVITASFTGGSGWGNSSGNGAAQVVNLAATTSTAVSSSPNPSAFGQSVLFTATVTSGSGVPAGTVTFTEGATVLASGVTVNGAGQASFSTAALAAGSHVITATFTGTSTWGNSSGNGAPQVVNPAPVTVTFTSVAAQDGWVLESGETTNVGGSINATTSNTSALRVGDNNQDHQYKSVVSFDTSSIPDGATIVSVTLRLLRGTVSGTNPFTTHGTCWVDVQGGSGFSGSTALATGDFQATATAVQAASLSNAASNGTWSTGNLSAAGLAALDKTGTTQLRVYFNLDDNDDLGNDYVGFYSGDNSTSANRPQLVVTYQ